MRKKTEVKRNAILNVARQVFCEMGYEKTSMNEIASRLGGSKATLYSYFPSKQLLFQEVMCIAADKKTDEVVNYLGQSIFEIPEDCLQQIEAVFNEVENTVPELPDRDIAGVLKDFGEKFVQMICRPEFQDLYRLAVEEAGRSKTPSLYYINGPTAGQRRIAAFLEIFMKKGQLRKANPFAAAGHLLGLLRADIFERSLFYYPGLNDAEDFRAKISNAIDAFLMIYGADAVPPGQTRQ